MKAAAVNLAIEPFYGSFPLVLCSCHAQEQEFEGVVASIPNALIELHWRTITLPANANNSLSYLSHGV
jgi:hypothetical protein